MPRKRTRTALEEAILRQSSEVYRSKLRSLDCRKNKEPNMSDIANKPVPSESKKPVQSKIFKQPSRRGRKNKKHSLFIDNSKFLKNPESKEVQTALTNSQDLITQLCEHCNKNLRILDFFRDRELGTKHESQIIQTDIDFSKRESLPTSEIKTFFQNSTVECNAENKSKKYSLEEVKEENTSANDISSAHSWRDSVDQNLTQDDSEIFSPEWSPIRDSETKIWFKTNRARFYLSNLTSDSNRLSEKVSDNPKYIPTEKHGAISNDLGIHVKSSPEDRFYAELHRGEKADEGDLKIDVIQRETEFAQIEENTLENSNSFSNIEDKEALLFATTQKNLLTEEYKLTDFLSSYSVKKSKIADEKIDPVFCKTQKDNTFEINNFLDEKKGCPRYAIPLEDISDKAEYHEFIIPILKPIQNHQLPAEFTLHVEKYFFIQNCPVVKCLSYLHRFPHSSPTNVWTFLCPTPSKIRLPNFIFISTASTPLPVLYNKKLHTFFENFMNIYSELKIGNNFIILNLLTDNESAVSTSYPLQFSTEHENIISNSLFNKLGLKINKARPTVIVETESIENSDFDHHCLFKKFGNFKFVSLIIMPDVIPENLKEFSSERQVSVSLPFTVQKDSCSCMFVDRKVAIACPIKTFLLTLTNNIQFIQSLTQFNSTVRPLEGFHKCALQKRSLSPKLDIQKLPKQLKFKKGKITRSSCKVTRFKKHESKIKVGENIALRTVKRKKEFETIGPKVKRSKIQTKVSFDENILPPNFIKEKSTQSFVNPNKIKYSEKEGMMSIDGNMQVLCAAPKQISQSIPSKTVVIAKLPEVENLFAQKRISLPVPKSKNIEHSLISNSVIKLAKYPSVSKAGESSESETLLSTTLREYYSKNKSVSSMVVDENLPLCLVQESNKRHSFVQAAPKRSAVIAITNNKNVRFKSHSSCESKNLEGLNFEAPSNMKSSIPNDILELIEASPSNSQNSTIPFISNLVQTKSFTASNIQSSIKTVNLTKTEQKDKKLNAVIAERIKSKSLSCHNTTFSNLNSFSEATLQHRSTQLECVKSNLIGLMEVHFFEPIQGRNPNLKLLVRIPNPINTTTLPVDRLNIYPNAILLQNLGSRQMVRKTFLHVRKITSIEEIECFIFDHENASTPINGFDKQTFMFQPSPNQKMPPQCEFENLRRLNDSFLPKGMYLLTPVRKNGACEIEIYNKLKNKHLSELKTEIGACYNLGKECVEVEDLLNIPDHLFFASNVQLSDIF